MLVSSNIAFLVIIFLKSEKISYVITSNFIVRLNSNVYILFLYKYNKSTISKGQDRRTGEIMLLHEINNNIPISRPYSLGVYQDESENLEL